MAHSSLARIAIQNHSHQAYMEHRAKEAAKQVDEILKEIDESNARVQALKNQVIAVLGDQLKEVKKQSDA